MTGEALIRGLAAGEGPAFARVLHNARFEGFGVVAYGAEETRALFARAPAVRGEIRTVCTAALAVLTGVDDEGRPAALLADLHNGWVTRLWRLGATALPSDTPAPTAVPRDLDMDQRGGRVAFEPRDHRDLASADAATVEAWAATRLAPAEPFSRPRPFVLRAASEEGRVGALLRTEGAAAGGLAGGYIATILGEEGITEVEDAAGLAAALATPWMASLR